MMLLMGTFQVMPPHKEKHLHREQLSLAAQEQPAVTGMVTLG